MPDPLTLESLVTTVQQLNAKFHENTAALHTIEEQLPDLVTKDEVREREHKVRRRLAKAAVVVALLLIAWLVYRHYDGKHAAERRQREAAALIAQEEEDRQNLLRGCERANDQRATLREIISLSIAGGTPIPTAGLDPELVELLKQSQQRSVDLRARLLALPGVQPVDCAQAFPPPTSTKEAA